jgi:DNA-binding NarL/FixJ family response regulator
MIKIIIVDDNEPFRKALKILLTKEFQAEIIGEASNGEEFLQLTNLYLADIILMDVMMPGIDGITLAQKVLWKKPELKIIAITMHTDKVYLISLIGAGFRGCIFKTNLFNDINNALNTVLEGHLSFPKNINVE